MNASELKTEIKTAFKSVKLEGGVSLKQAAVMSNRGEGFTNLEFSNLPRKELTDDWESLTEEFLASQYADDYYENLSHLDAKGFRYYTPALMLIALDEELSATTEWLLYNLDFKKDDSWNYHMNKVSLLDKKQSAAIAHFLEFMRSVLPEEQKQIGRMMERFWHEFL